MDVFEKREVWKQDPSSPYYDYSLLMRLIKDLKSCRESQDMKGLMKLLKIILSKSNISGIDNEELYSQTYWGTKYLVHDFVQQVLESLIIVRDSSAIDTQSKLDFFRKVKRMYGRTALLLSGGASFGYYHLGVIKTLFEAKLLPKIISGTSAGAMIASLIW